MRFRYTQKHIAMGLVYNIRIMKVKKVFEDTKGVIRICKMKNGRPHNDQKKKHKRINKDLQNLTQKTEDRGTRTPLKNGG